MRMMDIEATRGQIVQQMLRVKGLEAEQIEEIKKIGTTKVGTQAIYAQIGAMILQKMAMFAMIYATQKLGQDSHLAAFGIGAMAGAIMGLAVAMQMASTAWIPGGLPTAMAIGAGVMGSFNLMMYDMMNRKPTEFEGYDEPIGSGAFSSVEGRAYGGPVYPKMANGGNVSSQPYMVGERGPELFVPHTSGNIVPNNEMGGVTINISGDVYDGDNFAQKVGQALPNALRNVNDIGGI
jgi:hypothetical protein